LLTRPKRGRLILGTNTELPHARYCSLCFRPELDTQRDHARARRAEAKNAPRRACPNRAGALGSSSSSSCSSSSSSSISRRFLRRREPDCLAIILSSLSDCQTSGFSRTKDDDEHELRLRRGSKAGIYNSNLHSCFRHWSVNRLALSPRCIDTFC